MLFECGAGGAQTLFQRRQFLFGRKLAFLGLGDVAKRLGVLRGEFAQPFFIEMNAPFLVVNLALEFQPALLHLVDLMLQRRKLVPQLCNLLLVPRHAD